MMAGARSSAQRFRSAHGKKPSCARQCYKHCIRRNFSFGDGSGSGTVNLGGGLESKPRKSKMHTAVDGFQPRALERSGDGASKEIPFGTGFAVEDAAIAALETKHAA